MAGAVAPNWDVAFGFWLVVFLFSLPVAWQGITLRVKTHEKLRGPVEIAFAGLSERSLGRLRTLRNELNKILPARSEPFDPEDWIVDPVQIIRPAKRAMKLLRQRSNLHRRYRLLLIVCTIARYVSIALALLLALALYLYVFAQNSGELWFWTCVGCVTTLALGLFLVALYSLLTNQIQQAIEAAEPLARED